MQPYALPLLQDDSVSRDLGKISLRLGVAFWGFCYGL